MYIRIPSSYFDHHNPSHTYVHICCVHFISTTSIILALHVHVVSTPYRAHFNMCSFSFSQQQISNFFFLSSLPIPLSGTTSTTVLVIQIQNNSIMSSFQTSPTFRYFQINLSRLLHVCHRYSDHFPPTSFINPAPSPSSNSCSSKSTQAFNFPYSYSSSFVL